MFRLEHTTEHRFISCNSLQQAITEYYRQYRNFDGSIPWQIVYNDQIVNLRRE